MNCDGSIPSNEGTSGFLSPLAHTAGEFRTRHYTYRVFSFWLIQRVGSRQGQSHRAFAHIILFSIEIMKGQKINY